MVISFTQLICDPYASSEICFLRGFSKKIQRDVYDNQSFNQCTNLASFELLPFVLHDVPTNHICTHVVSRCLKGLFIKIIQLKHQFSKMIIAILVFFRIRVRLQNVNFSQSFIYVQSTQSEIFVVKFCQFMQDNYNYY